MALEPSHYARWLLIGLGVVGVGLGSTWWLSGAGRVAGATITRVVTLYVSPTGVDAPGRGGTKVPLKTIGAALKQARPGTTIKVLPGTYTEKLVTAVNGTAKQPITLQAVNKVILKGGTSGRILELRHDYYRLNGFEFAGGDVGLWLQEADHAVISKNIFHDAQGECVRLKYQSSDNHLENNQVYRCGRHDFGGAGGGKNGEGFYIGTAPEQLSKNPTRDVDQSDHNLIRNNTFNTAGNECVDIKEGSSGNTVEFNDCTGQQDVESGGMDARGSNNVFRYNRIRNNVGAGVRLGGDNAQDGISNQVYGNLISGNGREAIKVVRHPQGQICGNTVSNNPRGLSNSADIHNDACNFVLASPGVPLKR